MVWSANLSQKQVFCVRTQSKQTEWLADCCTSLISLNNDREVPAVIFLSRSTRELCWSSHPSWAHSEFQSPHPLWSPRHRTDWEDWEPSARSAPPTKGPPIVCPVPQRQQKQVSTHHFSQSAAGDVMETPQQTPEWNLLLLYLHLQTFFRLLFLCAWSLHLPLLSH